MSFAYPQLFARGLPDPAVRWTGFAKYNFIGGHNDPTQFPVEALTESALSVLYREGSKLALYNLSHGPLGYAGLRTAIADKAARYRGISCSADEVLITSGSLQGLDLVNQLLLEPGDTVILEALTYEGAIKRCKRAGVNVVGVSLDDCGLSTEALADTLAALKNKGIRPKYIYTIPTVQNPTGSVMPLERRHALLAIARQFGVPVFEDECYADLVRDGNGPPALYALDPAQVIHIGSFSKSLAPALRLGYVIADWEVLRRLAACKTDGGTGAVEQLITAEFFKNGFDRHLEKLKTALREKLDTMVEALKSEFGESVEMSLPKGGIFLWIRLREVDDVMKLVQPAAQAGIAFNPGPEWACDPQTAKSCMRLCFAYPSKEDIRAGIAALAQVCRAVTGRTALSRT